MVETIQYITKLNNNTSKIQNKCNNKVLTTLENLENMEISGNLHYSTLAYIFFSKITYSGHCLGEVGVISADFLHCPKVQNFLD